MCVYSFLFFFFKQKTAYEMRISDWSSDVCSSDLAAAYTPAGELLVKAELRDGKLLISTDLSQSRSVALWKGLSGDGLQLKMQPAPDCPARPKIGRASCRERVCQYV